MGLEHWMELARAIGVPSAIVLLFSVWVTRFLVPTLQAEITTARRENHVHVQAQQAEFVKALEDVEERHQRMADQQEKWHIQEQAEHAGAVKALAAEVKAQGEGTRRLIEKIAGLGTDRYPVKRAPPAPGPKRPPSDAARTSPRPLQRPVSPGPTPGSPTPPDPAALGGEP